MCVGVGRVFTVWKRVVLLPRVVVVVVVVLGMGDIRGGVPHLSSPIVRPMGRVVVVEVEEEEVWLPLSEAEP